MDEKPKKWREPSNWEEAWNLETYVISLFAQKKTESLEFKSLMLIYGRAKLVAIWEKFQASKKTSPSSGN